MDRTGLQKTIALVLAAACVLGVGIWGVAAARRSNAGELAAFVVSNQGGAGDEPGGASVPGGGSASPLAAGTEVRSTSTSTTVAICVQVIGAVRNPGVYQIPRGSRVFQALEAAGGAGPEADLEAVNLAAPVADGSQIVVPRVGEGPAAGAVAAGKSGTSLGAGTPVSLSTADATALDALPGIGPATAAAIIAYREEHGPFQSVEQLEDVPGIGPATVARLHDLVVP